MSIRAVFGLSLKIWTPTSNYNIRRLSAVVNWYKIHKQEPVLPSKDNPIIMKLDTPEFKNIFTEELITLVELFKKYNYEIRIAGGAVRDLLMELQPTDLDFATTATPTQMKEMFTKENVRMINSNGEKHGTITPRINNKMNFEVTTLRIDKVTDGRHAEVEFTTNWMLDANRRDLTINSMFLDFNGQVYDYFNGYEDLKKRRIAFVGDPVARIQEDYLRIFRYFRFYGRISDVSNNHEEANIKAIKENISGLQKISGERIWVEWSKILSGRFGGELTTKLIECGAAPYIGLSSKPDIENFLRIYHRGADTKLIAKPITLISGLLKNVDDVTNLHQRLKLSAFDRDLAYFIVHTRDEAMNEKSSKYYEKLIIHKKGVYVDPQKYVCELLKYLGEKELFEKFDKWVLPIFPLSGRLVAKHCDKTQIKIVLQHLKDLWIDSDYKLDTNELSEKVPKIVRIIENNDK